MIARRADGPRMSKGRLEAFSDGVFAIAITLLVLEITVPKADGGELWSALGNLWPSYIAYAISFLTIGVMWFNHHALFNQVGLIDRGLIYYNLLLLALVSFIPFPTAVLAEYIAEAANRTAAVSFYGFTMVGLGIAFSLLWRHLRRTPAIQAENADIAGIRTAGLQSWGGSGAYAVGTAVSFFAPVAGLAIFAALVIGFAIGRPFGSTDSPK